jgi:hypothetical protein
MAFDTASRWRYSPEEDEELFAYELAEALGFSVQRARYDR